MCWSLSWFPFFSIWSRFWLVSLKWKFHLFVLILEIYHKYGFCKNIWTAVWITGQCKKITGRHIPAYHNFNNKWNLPVYFQIMSVIYSHHLHPSEIEFEHQFRWTELHLTAPSWRSSYYSLGNNLEQKRTRSIMIAKVLACMTKGLSFTLLSLASWER